MMKRLFITLLSVALLASPLYAQQEEGKWKMPKVGTFQVELLLGSSDYFSQDGLSGYSYLLPSDDGSDIGFGADYKTFLNLGDINNNSIMNMVGVKFGVYVHPQIEVNALFGMNIGLTPKRDYIEGDSNVPDMVIPGQQYVVGEAEHLFHIQIGANYRFNLENKRIVPYLGAMGGFQMARITAMYPYTGETDENGDAIELTRASYRAGQAWALECGIVAGIDYQLAPGLYLGVEVCPAKYQFSVMELHPAGLEPYAVSNHAIKILTQPRLKLGFRF